MFLASRHNRGVPSRNQLRPYFEELERRELLSAARFAVIGDYGDDGAAEASVARMVRGWNPEFVATTGDNNYPRGEAETIDANIGKHYHEFIGDYAGEYGAGSATNRFFPAIGNHDWMTEVAGLPQPYLDYFTLPGNERYYDVQYGPVHLFMVDSDTNEPDGATANSVQADWLRAGLAASDAAWKIVVMHHAPYSSGNVHGSNMRMQWPFEEWGADLVLAGHEHTYERLDVGGITYVVNGLGGRNSYNFADTEPESAARYREDYGAMLFEANPSQLTASFRTIDPVDQIIDMFQLRKDASVPQTLVPPGAMWRYWDLAATPAAGWTAQSYDDAAWELGPAQLGYGEGDEATTVDFGGNPAAKPITTYFRHKFEVSDPSRFAGVQFDLMRDDGAIVYLNGQEVWRTNMPSGVVASSTLARHEIDVGAEESRYRMIVDVAAFLPGTNVVAVEMHQNNAASNDLSFDLALSGIVESPRHAADLNRDGAVGLADVAILQGNLGQTLHATAAMGDLNGDRAIDRRDAALLAMSFGRDALSPPLAKSAAVALGIAVPTRRRVASPRPDESVGPRATLEAMESARRARVGAASSDAQLRARR